jgi:hypothetical protein
VLDALRTIHQDPGWAIVQLVEPILGRRGHRARAMQPAPLIELVSLPGRRALIVVQSELFGRLRADGRAFLAFDQPGGLADLEVAVLDQLEAAAPKSAERARLSQVRDILRAWRHDAGLVFRTKSIIVVEGLVGVERRPLASLQPLDGKAEPHQGGTAPPA